MDHNKEYNPYNYMCQDLGWYKRHAIKAAEDFHYGKKVIKAIKEAKTDDEIGYIMRRARKEKFGY